MLDKKVQGLALRTVVILVILLVAMMVVITYFFSATGKVFSPLSVLLENSTDKLSEEGTSTSYNFRILTGSVRSTSRAADFLGFPSELVKLINFFSLSL